ncbi:glycosyltransferase family 4 protein [Propionicicella superfundia]|uniref:glycosyltransferase family 4 protein n=1 Tax=Propionicicella superfundia TaxID=348582 RepID=UPI00041A34D1
MTTLLVTNDFGPRIGGIETFCRAVCAFLGDDVVVLTSDQEGADAYDASLPFPVVRLRGPLLPTRAVARRAADLLRSHRCDVVVFGAAAPLGLLADSLRRAGARRLLALTHGHEVWWARVPVTARLLRRIGDSVDVLTTISAHTEAHIARALSPAAREHVVRMPPPVDLSSFRPDAAPREPHTCVAAGRFVRQKGFDTLLRAWARVQRDLGPRYRLRLVGGGPEEAALRRRAAGLPYPAEVEFTGPVAHGDLPPLLAAAGVFALPVRSLYGGLYAEGFGVCFAEAAATGLPVVVGDSGGAPETVEPGRTGTVVDPGSVAEVAAAVSGLLADPARAAAWGSAGRARAEQMFGAERSRTLLRRLIGVGDDTDEVAGLREDRRGVPVERRDVIAVREAPFDGDRRRDPAEDDPR